MPLYDLLISLNTPLFFYIRLPVPTNFSFHHLTVLRECEIKDLIQFWPCDSNVKETVRRRLEKVNFTAHKNGYISKMVLN